MYEPFNEVPPVRPQDLIRWGSKGWMHIHARNRTKLTEKAEPVLRLGYTNDSNSDCYVVLKLNNNEVVRTRDVKWEEARPLDMVDPYTTHTSGSDGGDDSKEETKKEHNNLFGGLQFRRKL